MLPHPLPPFLNVLPAGIAQLRVPDYGFAVDRIVLQLGGGAFTKAMITDISLKLGTRTVYKISGTRLDAINKYKGIFDHANFITLDFTERDAPALGGKIRGNFDLPALTKKYGDFIIEVTIAGATTPTLSATMMVSPSLGDGNIAIMKLLYFQAATNASGKFALNFDPRGSVLKRLWIFYGGTDWGAAANGNLSRVEVKKNGLVVYDAEDLLSRFIQQEYRKVPQSRLFCVDFIADNLQQGALETAGSRSLEFNTYLTAADTLNCYAELIDIPDNT